MIKKKWKITGIIVLIVISSPFIAKFGYCQGWWLTSNPWAYYWWLCDCSPEFEQSLYPDNIEVVVSACYDQQSAALSPNGRYMIFSSGIGKSYLLDLVTGDKKSWPHDAAWEPPMMGFRTNTLVLVSEFRTWKLVDVTDGSIIDLIELEVIPGDKSSPIPEQTLQALEKADRVLAFGNTALALSAHPKQNPNKNFAVFYPKWEHFDTILSENDIDYKYIESCWNQLSCLSHDDRFKATQTTISTADGQLLAEFTSNPSFRDGLPGIIILGWAHNDSGVYLQFDPHSYIIDGDGFVTPATYPLPQPIVKLKVPEEYRQTKPTPAP